METAKRLSNLQLELLRVFNADLAEEQLKEIRNLSELILSLENVEKIRISFKWQLIDNDPDDNKFVDCAISAQAQYLVTNDKHFNHLKDIEFPPIEVIDADDFLEILKMS